MKKNISLKTRIFIFSCGILILMCCTYIFVLSRFITGSTEERLNTDYENILTEACDTVENILWNMTLTSQQLLDNEEIQINLKNYYKSSDRYLQKDINSKLLDAVYSTTMFNSNIGLIFFYNSETKDFAFSSLPANIYPNTNPILYSTSGFQFCGPCKSQSTFIGNPVFILSRKETLSENSKIVLSVESGYYDFDRVLNSVKQKSAFLIFTNAQKKIIYSTLPETFDTAGFLEGLSNGTRRDFRFFNKQASQGWEVHILIPDSVYTHDYQLFLHDFIVCTMVLVILVGFLTLYSWQSIYKPLQLFDRQLSCVLSDEITVEQIHSSIPEYEYLLHKITLLQKQIREMINTAINQEKIYSHMQLEKLRAQINPHFLLNTLNTLHWQALMNNQTDIDKIIQALSHLLAYNLDKQSCKTNLKNELAAVKEYATLQKVRYSFDFAIHSQEEPENLFFPCPKFIFQPLIENSLSHGYRERMKIDLSIYVSELVEIKISDTGTGIPEEKLKELQKLTPLADYSSADKNSTSSACEHSGIGLQYVIQSLNDFYNGKYEFTISSTYEKGTTIILKLPKLRGTETYAENSHY